MSLELLIHWAGFIGAWLLVLGPLYQASIELSEDAEQAVDIRESMKNAPEVEHVSLWWWLLPPVYYLKRRRVSKRQQDAVLRQLTPEQRKRTMTFVNKAGGWFTVSAGAFLIALKETWELVELSRWPEWLFWVLDVVLLVAVIWNAGVRVARSHGILDAYAAADEGEPVQPRRRR